MSRAYKCDRCGKLQEDRLDANIQHYHANRTESGGNMNELPELCETCDESFKEWWDDGDGDE